jgi:hypothetical protein
MNYFMVRSFDHAGYCEARLVLMVVGLLVAGWRAGRGDRCYLVMFFSGVFFQALLECVIMLLALRGAAYRLSVFGVTLRTRRIFALDHLGFGGSDNRCEVSLLLPAPPVAGFSGRQGLQGVHQGISRPRAGPGSASSA